MSDQVAVPLAAALDRAAVVLRVAAPDPGLELARHCGIGGYVARHRGQGDASRDESLARRFHERLMLDAATELSAALTSRGVPHFFVRGIALVGTVYAPGDREMADLDLFVRSEAVLRARETLADLGYSELPAEEQDGPAALRSKVSLAREPGPSAVEAVAVDLHWAVEPVNRLLPRPGTALPASVWDGVQLGATLPAPAPAHHAALLVHHLVHHDLLHVRGVLDLALLRHDSWTSDGAAYEDVAGRLGVLRAARFLHAVLIRAFGYAPVPGVELAPRDWRGRQLERALALDRWLVWAGSAAEGEHVTITLRRMRRRLLLLDRVVDARLLVADVVLPPREHLRWRWPGEPSAGAAWRRHLQQVAGKALGR